MVKYWIDKGVDVDALTNNNETAIEIARRKAHVEVVQLLQQKYGQQ